MNMYRKNGTKIGTKTVQQGAGLQKPNGNFGNGVTMKFNPPQEQPKVQQHQQNYNNSYYDTMGRGVTAPEIRYETPKGDENFSRILRNIAQSRNAKAQMQYDKMNMNLFNKNANRVQNQNQYNLSRQDKNSHFDRTMDFNIQKQKQVEALKNVMTPYQQQQIQQNEYNNRVKNFNKKLFKSQMPESVSDNIGDRDFQIAKNKWLNTGVMPKFEKYDDGSWFNDGYRVAQDQTPIAQAPQSNQPSSDLAQQRAYKRWVQAKNEEIMNR